METAITSMEGSTLLRRLASRYSQKFKDTQIIYPLHCGELYFFEPGQTRELMRVFINFIRGPRINATQGETAQCPMSMHTLPINTLPKDTQQYFPAGALNTDSITAMIMAHNKLNKITFERLYRDYLSDLIVEQEQL